MEYHLDDAVRQIPGKVTSYCNFASFTMVLDMLDEENTSILRRSCLWPLHSLKDIQFSGQLLDGLLCRLLKPVEEDVLRFDLGGKVASFSKFEFALITGLRCTGEETARARIPKNRRLLIQYFHGQMIVTLAQLGDAFRNCDQMSDKLKLGMVLILESVLRCHHRKTSIDIFHLEVVDDIDMFNNYPWGHRCFMDTLRHFKRGYSMPKGGRPERKYDAYGLPLALQIWVYEIVPILAARYARREETCFPRMHHWRAQDKPLAKHLSALLDDPELEVLTELTPSIEEEDQIYLCDLSRPAATDDQECRSISPLSRISPPLRVLPPPRVSPPPRSPPARSRSTSHSDDLFDLLTTFMRDMRGEVAELRAGLGALHTEVVALRGDIADLRGTHDYRVNDG